MAAPVRVMRFCALCQQHDFYHRILAHNVMITRHMAADLVSNNQITIDPDVKAMLVAGGVKHRAHPGVMQVKKVKLPKRLLESVNLLIEKYPMSKLKEKSAQLVRYLQSRQLPMEGDELKYTTQQIHNKVLANDNTDTSSMTEIEMDLVEKKLKDKTLSQLNKSVYHWKPIQYSASKGFLYLIGRLANDYSVMYRIFSEMEKRVPDFKPHTLFDFGSGIGSTLWAANSVWETSLQQHYCVDSSADMSTIARLLLQDGEEEKQMCFPNVYFRQYFPPSIQNKYDLVVSAFTLMELPSQAERLKAVLALWKKTDQFLVLAENGTYAGYQAVLEARDFLLQLGEEGFPGLGDESLRGHVFAPCPHDKPCPRYVRQDGTPCNFIVPYQPLKVKGSKQTDDIARFAFVVLRKGERSTEDASWPRIVRPTSTPSRRVHCRTCASSGELEVSVVTSSKHSRDLYWCARASKWGDLLPTVPATADDREKTRENTTESEAQDDNSNTDIASDINIGISGVASTDR